MGTGKSFFALSLIHIYEKITANPQKEEREKVLKEIRQLENLKKILENKQRNEERRVRTRRLIERGAVLDQKTDLYLYRQRRKRDRSSAF